MANPPSSSGANAQQQEEVQPEAIWIPSIRDLYPNLLSQTSFLPPIHFNRTPHNVEVVEGQNVLVRDNPGSSGPRLPHPPPAPRQVAGRVFVDHPPWLMPFHTQDSDHRDDAAQQRCLQALSNIPGQVMMVVSCLEFQKYLNNYTNPLYAAAIAQLPTIRDPSLPPPVADGECDIVIIHRVYGLLIGEVKSVGDSDFFRSQDPADQAKLIRKQVEKAVKQLHNQETALRHLVSDLPPIRITRTLLLPNISSGQLRSALSAFPPVLQALCGSLSLQTDVSLAVGHCLCQQDVVQPMTWWQTLHAAGPDPSMTDGLYERLVARFCGPASTVDIPTAGPPRKVVRSLGQAVAETGLRFSSLTLTPVQVALLNTQPRFLYLQGPPGTGKTVLLLLKALQWARQGRQVVILSGEHRSRAVTLLLEAQLQSIVRRAAATRVVNQAVARGILRRAAATRMVRRAAASRRISLATAVSLAGRLSARRIHRQCYNFRASGFHAGAAVCRLRQRVKSGRALVLFDEIDPYLSNQYMQWLTEVRAQLPAVSVWAAGVFRLDRRLPGPLPRWLQVQTLQESLRCPPTVIAQLRELFDQLATVIHPYTDPQLPVATQGPQVRRLQHTDQPGHSEGSPWQCVTCTDYVASDVISQLRVGQPGHDLQYRDVWILYAGREPRADDVMVQRLQRHHGLPVGVVTSRPLSQAHARELGLAVTDQITAATWEAVQGLERRVVVVLGLVWHSWALLSQSRCSGSLHLIA